MPTLTISDLGNTGRWVTAPVISHSQDIHEESFRILCRTDSFIKVVIDSNRTFTLFMSLSAFPDADENGKLDKCCKTLSALLVALNVVTLGHFEWNNKNKKPNAFWIYHADSKMRYPFDSVSDYVPECHQEKDFSENKMYEALQICPHLIIDPQFSIIDDYLKGLFHLGLTSDRLNFQKDAFGNFYRVFEYFILRRHINKTKFPAAEVKSIITQLISLGFPESVTDHFVKRLYKYRSSQVMHAQNDQVNIGWEDVMIMKIITDRVMQIYYQRLGFLSDHPL